MSVRSFDSAYELISPICNVGDQKRRLEESFVQVHGVLEEVFAAVVVRNVGEQVASQPTRGERSELSHVAVDRMLGVKEFVDVMGIGCVKVDRRRRRAVPENEDRASATRNDNSQRL